MQFINRLNGIQFNEEIEALAEKFNINSDVIKVLYSRGYKTEEKIYEFFNADSNNFYNPFLLKGMSQAVDRINLAIENNESILIFGDYDVDGITATAMLTHYLSTRLNDINFFLPDRAGYGYGLSQKAIEYVAEKFMPDLIITVDCGITTNEQVDYINELGIDVIVTDHHEPDSTLPNCITIDPKIAGQEYPFSDLCGAGVAFKLISALKGENALEYIYLAALSTITDMVSLTDENRLIVKLGLMDINNADICPKWLEIMLDILDVQGEVDTSTIGFLIGPRINALGRLSDPTACVELMLTTDENKMREILDILNSENLKRQQLTNDYLLVAEKNITADKLYLDKFICVYDKSFSSGLNGLLASKLSEKYSRPAIVFSLISDELVGSARSIDGIDIFNLLKSVKDLLIRFGGHSMAGGLSIKRNKYDEFLKRVREYLKSVPDSVFERKIQYDIDLTDRRIDIDYINDFNKLAPFGVGHLKPMFKCNISRCNANVLKNYTRGVMFSNSGLKYLYYDGADKIDVLNSQLEKQFVFELKTNTYNGVTEIMAAIKESKLNINDKLPYDFDYKYLKSAYYVSNFNVDIIKEVEFVKALNEKLQILYSTLIIINTSEGYEYFTSKIKPKLKNVTDNFIINIKNIWGDNKNCILISPDENADLSHFTNVFIVDKPLDFGVLKKINFNKTVKIFSNEFLPKNFLKSLSTDREVFVEVYKQLVKNKDKLMGNDFSAIFNLLSKDSSNLNINQCYFCFLVFVELKLVNFDAKNNCFIIDNNIKVDLISSKVYNTVKETKRSI